MRGFLKHWAPELRDRVVVQPYEATFRRRTLPAGTHLFSDIERLRPAELRLAAALADRVAEAGSRVLNHPRDVLTRHALLEALYAAGINRFRSHRRLDPEAMRFPVFLRSEREHDGPLTPLLRDARELRRAVLRLGLRPLALRGGLLAVEYEETRDAEGLYRKYSVLRVGDAHLGRHILVSRNWMLKVADLVDAESLRAEEAYLHEVPQLDVIRRCFAIARVEYGRIDYAVREDGRLAVWEINTNPGQMPRRAKLHAARIPFQERAVRPLIESFVALDRACTATAPIRGFGRADSADVLRARLAQRLLG